MEVVFHSLVTSAEGRDSASIDAQLEQALSVGAYWI